MYKGQLDLDLFQFTDTYSRARNQDLDYDDEDPQDAPNPDNEETTAKHISLELIDLPVDTSTSSGEIQHAQVQNDVVVTIGSDWRVSVFDQEGLLPKQTFTVEIPHARGKDSEEIYRLFVDPLGRHAIVATTSGDAHYISLQLALTFRLPKPKEGSTVYESIAWDKSNTSDITTNQILVGSRNGAIFELKVDAKTKTATIDLVYQIRDESSAIVGLEVESCIDSRKYIVLATTNTRIYHFVGEGQFESFFANYSRDASPQFQEFPESNTHPSFRPSLLIYHRKTSNYAQSFAWMTPVGLNHGTFDLSKGAVEDDNVVRICSTIPLCRQSTRDKNWDVSGVFPVGMAISEFHFYFLFDDNFVVICHPAGLPWMSTTDPKLTLKPHDMNNRVVFSHHLSGQKRDMGKGVIFDSAKRKVYLYSGVKLLGVVVDHEERNAWRLYLDRALDKEERTENRESYFRSALRLCNNDVEKSDAVRIAMGDFYFSRKKYSEAVKFYSETDKSFEDTVTKLLARESMPVLKGEKDAKEVLLEYVLARLDFMKRRRASLSQERKQFYCLCTWVVEMYLERITRLDVSVGDPNAKSKLMQAQGELNKFLAENNDMLDHETTLQLIQSHGRTSEMIMYCQKTNSHTRVVEHYMNSNLISEALALMCNRCTQPQDEKLWYLYSPRIIVKCPKELIERGWMGAAQQYLKARKLIPALTKYRVEMNEDKSSTNLAIHYLKWAIKRSSQQQDGVIYNMLLSLYAQQADSRPLEEFIQNEEHYDAKYALRLCLEGSKLRACVHVYSKMKLYDDAVALALKIRDVPLAKDQVTKPEEEDQKKRLWLMIAEHVIQEEKNAKSALSLIKESKDVIKVEDVLPYFSDNVLIQDFKTEICRSLDDYADQIKKLKGDMEKATQSANQIRADIKENRHRFGFISSAEKCNLCSGVLLSSRTTGFYIFPSCNHVFHKTCLIEQVKPHLTKPQRDRINLLTQKLEMLRNKKSTGGGGNAGNVSASEQEMVDLKRELDDMVAGSCVFCGPYMVDEIDKPFIDGAGTWDS